jgi:hypothetical protein
LAGTLADYPKSCRDGTEVGCATTYVFESYQPVPTGVDSYSIALAEGEDLPKMALVKELDSKNISSFLAGEGLRRLKSTRPQKRRYCFDHKDAIMPEHKRGSVEDMIHKHNFIASASLQEHDTLPVDQSTFVRVCKQVRKRRRGASAIRFPLDDTSRHQPPWGMCTRISGTALVCGEIQCF